MEFRRALDEFCDAAAAGDGERFSHIFTPEATYHDGFYGAFRGRPAIARMLEEHFHGDATDLVWELRDPVWDGSVGYATYIFSYTSTMPESEGRRVVFEGISRFLMDGGLIAEYHEVFDASVAMSQLGFPSDRIAAAAARRAERLWDRFAATRHEGTAQ